jgi:peptidoglycan/LPS O-acetylase OafA/YrhL
VQRLDALTGMRGVAAFLVLGFHAVLCVWLAQLWFGWPATAFESPVSRWFFGAGWTGVDFFFVLSGFLLARPLLDAPRAWPTLRGYRVFVAKRLLRIAPAYYASFLVFLALVGWSTYPVFATSAKGLLIHALYLHNFWRDQQFAMSGVAWTLAVELQFYLLLPILVQPFRRLGPAAAVLFLGAALAYEWWAYRPADALTTRFLEFQFPAFLAHFGFGIAAAQLFARAWRPRVPPDLAIAAGLAAFLVVPAVALGYSRQFEPIDVPFYFVALRPLAGLAFAITILFALQPASAVGRILTLRPLRWLGDISYSLYLTHLFWGGLFIVTGAQWAFRKGVPGFLPIMVAGSLALAWLMYVLVERPSLRLKERVTQRMEAASNPGTEAPIHA